VRVEGEESRQNSNDEQHHKDKEEGTISFLLNKHEKVGSWDMTSLE